MRTVVRGAQPHPGGRGAIWTEPQTEDGPRAVCWCPSIVGLRQWFWRSCAVDRNFQFFESDGVFVHKIATNSPTGKHLRRAGDRAIEIVDPSLARREIRSDRCTRRTRKRQQTHRSSKTCMLVHPPFAARIDTIGKAHGDSIDLGLKTAARRVIMRDA